MILVTGATGCLGGAVVRHLAGRGHQVRALLAPDHTRAASRVLAAGADHTCTGDVRDPAAMRRAVHGCTAVVHLAGSAGVAVPSATEMMSVNRDGTRAVAGAAHQAGARMVHISSASAVGLSPDTLIDEDHHDAGTVAHPYPLSKRAADAEVTRTVVSGLRAVVLCPGAVLAPGGDPRRTWSGLPDLLRRRAVPLAPPGGFGFCSASTFVEAVVSSLTAGGDDGRRYLLVDQNLTYRDLFALVAGRVGARGPLTTAPRWLVRTAAHVAPQVLTRSARRTSVLRPDAVPFLTWTVRYSGARARAALGLPTCSTSSLIDQLTGSPGPVVPDPATTAGTST